MPVFMLPAAKGTCQFCAVAHTPNEPHNRDSLYYQMRFQTIYGRAPTWADAVAHCSTLIALAWQAELERRGAWTEPKEGEPIEELDKNSGNPTPIPMPNLVPKVVKLGRKTKKKKGKR